MKDLECSNSSNKIEKGEKLAKKTPKKLETKVRSQKAFKEGLKQIAKPCVCFLLKVES
jgi:hypothetical protein